MNTTTTNFIANFIQEKESNLFIAREHQIESTRRIKNDKTFVGLFDYGSLGKNYKNFTEYFQKEDKKKYKLIVADLPLGSKRKKIMNSIV